MRSYTSSQRVAYFARHPDRDSSEGEICLYARGQASRIARSSTPLNTPTPSTPLYTYLLFQRNTHPNLTRERTQYVTSLLPTPPPPRRTIGCIHGKRQEARGIRGKSKEAKQTLFRLHDPVRRRRRRRHHHRRGLRCGLHERTPTSGREGPRLRVVAPARERRELPSP